MTYAVAGQLYGSGSLEQQAVKNGWDEVGITPGSINIWQQILAFFIDLLNRLRGNTSVVIPATRGG